MPSNSPAAQSPCGRADALARISDQLDRLIAEERLGTRSQHEFEDREERAQAIAAELIAAYRAPTKSAARTKPGKAGGMWAY